MYSTQYVYNFSLLFFLSFETTSHRDMQLGARRRRIRGDREKRRILLEQGVRTLVRHSYPRFVRLALRIISLGFGHRDVRCGCDWMCTYV